MKNNNAGVSSRQFENIQSIDPLDSNLKVELQAGMLAFSRWFCMGYSARKCISHRFRKYVFAIVIDSDFKYRGECRGQS